MSEQCQHLPGPKESKNYCKNTATLDFLGFGNSKGLYEHSRQKDKTLKTPKTTGIALYSVFKKIC